MNAPPAPSWRVMGPGRSEYDGPAGILTLQIEQLPIDSVHADPANVRRHPERNLAAIKASLARFGQQRPILVDSAGIVRAGNGTLEAARALGWQDIKAVRTPLTGSEATAYAIADNRTAELAEWDGAALAETLRALQSESIDLGDVGYSDDELWALIDELADQALANGTLAEDPGPQIDRAAELQQKWQTEPGQLWVIPSKSVPGGEHRLLCGDSTRAEDVARVMGGEKAQILATDPPYGVSFQGAQYNPTAKEWGAIENDDLRGADLDSWLQKVWKTWIPHVAADFAFYCWTAAKTEQIAAAAAAAAAGIHIQSQLIWVKNVFALGQADYQWCHENCLYGFFKGKQHRWLGGRDKRTTWMVDRVHTHDYEHPTQKPVELFVIPMTNHTYAGEICAEPFSGSGSQYVAAEQTGRLCRGIEIAPQYVAVALERLADMGLSPFLQAGG